MFEQQQRQQQEGSDSSKAEKREPVIKSLRRSLVPGQIPGQNVQQKVPAPVSIAAVQPKRSSNSITADKSSARAGAAAPTSVDVIPEAGADSGIKGGVDAKGASAVRVRRTTFGSIGSKASAPKASKPARKSSLAISGVSPGGSGSVLKAGESLPEPLEFL